MITERIKKLLSRREGIRLEFKQAATELPRNLFETICAMLNREGGDILLGVQDDGSITGVNAERLSAITADLVNYVK